MTAVTSYGPMGVGVVIPKICQSGLILLAQTTDDAAIPADTATVDNFSHILGSEFMYFIGSTTKCDCDVYLFYFIFLFKNIS